MKAFMVIKLIGIKNINMKYQTVKTKERVVIGDTLKIVREYIIFALAVKLVCLVLGALGIANMWLAIFADVGVTVIAVINATRALKIK